jgi:hypothetical protein
VGSWENRRTYNIRNVGTHVLNLNSWVTWTPSNLTYNLNFSHHACLSSFPCGHRARAPEATRLAASPPPQPRHVRPASTPCPPRRPTARRLARRHQRGQPSPPCGPTAAARNRPRAPRRLAGPPRPPAPPRATPPAPRLRLLARSRPTAPRHSTTAGNICSGSGNDQVAEDFR